LRCDEFAEIQGAEATRIANGVKLLGRENDERVGAFNLIERVAERSGKIAALVISLRDGRQLRCRCSFGKSSRDVPGGDAIRRRW